MPTGDWETLSYHPEEISEIYLGANATDAWKEEVSALAERVNPHVAIYEMFYGVHGNLLTRFFAKPVGGLAPKALNPSGDDRLRVPDLLMNSFPKAD